MEQEYTKLSRYAMFIVSVLCPKAFDLGVGVVVSLEVQTDFDVGFCSVSKSNEYIPCKGLLLLPNLFYLQSLSVP